MPEFVITTETDGKTNYLKFDAASGGYPFFSDGMSNAAHFCDIPNVRAALINARKSYPHLKLTICEIGLTPIKEPSFHDFTIGNIVEKDCQIWMITSQEGNGEHRRYEILGFNGVISSINKYNIENVLYLAFNMKEYLELKD